jgi:putative transport protein
MNVVAVGVVLLNIAVAVGLYYALGGRIELPMMVGILCGAVTNTPGLGAANEALSQLEYDGPQIAMGYACAYPLGVLGIIGSIILVRLICKINLKQEEEEIAQQEAANPHLTPNMMHLEVHNEALNGKTLMQVKNFIGRDFVISRILQNGHVNIPSKDTVFHVGDQMFIVCAEDDAEAIIAFIGPKIKVDWEKQDMPMVSRRILVTQSKMNGKRLGELHLRTLYGVNITRVNRSGMDIFASYNLTLQVGDRVMVVGPQDAVERVANLMGNSLKRLDHPNIVTIFVGIFLGILFGSLPIAFPGIPTPVKLGLAGGPLIVAILMGRFGYKLKLVTYTTMSANLMLREIGIALFLASVGVKAGANFVQTVVEGDGLLYVGCGFLITVIPLLVMGVIARMRYKMNYFMLMGLMAGSTTDPPALAYANQTANNNAPAVGYSTVYPVTMFLRILTAQLLILILAF